MACRRLKAVKLLEEDLVQKRKQVLTLRQSMDKQSSSHVNCAAAHVNDVLC